MSESPESLRILISDLEQHAERLRAASAPYAASVADRQAAKLRTKLEELEAFAARLDVHE